MDRHTNRGELSQLLGTACILNGSLLVTTCIVLALWNCMQGSDIYKTKPSKSTLRSKLKRLNSPSINKPLHDKEFSFRQVKFIWKLKCRMGGTKSFSDIGSVPYQQAESWVGCSQQTSSTPPILVPNESSCYLGNKTIPGFEIFT